MKEKTSFSTMLKNLSIPSNGITLENFIHELGQRGFWLDPLS